MLDDHFPTVEITFLQSLIDKSTKIQGSVKAGKSIAYILTGTQHIGKRTIVLRQQDDGQVDYMMATGIAIWLGLMGELLKWLEENRKWKDGGYFE